MHFQSLGISRATGELLPKAPVTHDLAILALRVERQRRILDARLRKAPQWRGQLRRELYWHARPGERERYVRACHGLMQEAAFSLRWTLDSRKLCDLHEAVVGGATFRDKGLTVGGHHNFPSAAEVPALVDAALERAFRCDESLPIRATRLHLKLLGVHPFADGNGRTARLAASLLLIRGGFRSSLFTAVEQHFHAAPLRYLEILDQFQYGEISEDRCVAHLLQAMVANSMYAAWFRARELRLQKTCARLHIPSRAIDSALSGYDLDPKPRGFAARLASSVPKGECPLWVLRESFTREEQVELSFQITRLLDEEKEVGAARVGWVCARPLKFTELASEPRVRR